MTSAPRPAAVTVGTRASALARAQTDLVLAQLAVVFPELECATLVVSTSGDRTQDAGLPLPEIGGKGLFTEELERALRLGGIDAAVHSLKDLPTDEAPGVVVAAVCAREDAGDCLVARDGLTLAELPAGSVVGTSSRRRTAQLLALRPDLDVRPVRGNVDTRVRKVRDGEYDAVVLAAAGLRRLDLDGDVTERLSPETLLPAPGQGALAIQCRSDDEPTRALLAALDDSTARAETTAERTFLRALGGGCAAPVAARATVTAGADVHMDGLVASLDGGRVVRVHGEGEPAALGERLAREALRAGADAILGEILA